MASKIKLDRALLKGLEPLSNLSHDKLDELAGKSVIEDLPAGRVLFRQGEKDNRILYLIAGQVELSNGNDSKPQIIKAKTPEAKFPLADGQPRPVTAKARGNITLLTVDPDLLEIIMDDTPLTGTEMEVTEISADDTTDWMLRFLQSRAFLKLPTENIQAILMRMEELPAKKGEIIIQQGQIDDYYYIIQSGQCAVSRRPAPKSQEIQLATLNEGDGFGEEALITNAKRNATITMLDDGVLMRLKKQDFLDYLAAPLITPLDEAETVKKVSNGALLIDVRTHDEFRQQQVDGSVNIPLTMLRLKTQGLNPHREYVLACSDGSRSAAAAFLLTQQGFNCYILQGGLDNASLKMPAPEQVTSDLAAAPSNKRTVAAEKTRQAAEDRARKISQEADTARREAENLARQTAQVEAAKRKAEDDLKRLQAEHQQAAAAATRQQAETARQQAEQELQKINAARRSNEQKQKSLDESLKRAQQIAEESTRAAETARKQAEKEAAEIRRKALEEADRLRREMEETRRRFEEQASQTQAQRQAAIEEARKQAQDVVRQTTEQARREAEKIRQEALAEAERLRAELEQAKQLVSERAEQEERDKRVKMLEEARARAVELADKTTRIAEQEAEEIRRKALDEAEELRAAMERTRQEVMQHAARAKAEAESRQRQEQQAEERLRRKQQQQAEQDRIDAEREARRQQAIRNAQLKKKEQARRMAEEIKAKLEKAEQQRQAEEERHHGEGLSVARATIKRKDGKIILEGDQDIFIFKEPSVAPGQITDEWTNEYPQPAQPRDELPSFTIDEPGKARYRPVNTQAIQAKLQEKSASERQHRKKRHAIAMAASLLIALGAGGVYVFMHPELVSETLLAAKSSANGSTNSTKAQASLSHNREQNKVSRKDQEKTAKSDAKARFQALLEEWKEITSD